MMPIICNSRSITLLRPTSSVSKFIWKPSHSRIIYELISLVALQNHNTVSTNQIISFVICSIWLIWICCFCYGNYSIQICCGTNQKQRFSYELTHGWQRKNKCSQPRVTDDAIKMMFFKLWPNFQMDIWSWWFLIKIIKIVKFN